MTNYFDLGMSILAYYNKTRGVGHSRATINGAAHDGDAIVIVANRQQAHYLQDHTRDTLPCIVLSDFDHKAFTYGSPIVFDNAAIIELIEGLLDNGRSLYVAQHNKIGLSVKAGEEPWETVPS